MRTEAIVYSIAVPVLVYWLWAALKSGEAWVKGGDISRTEEPIRFWAFVALMAAMLIGCIVWLSAWFGWGVDIGRR